MVDYHVDTVAYSLSSRMYGVCRCVQRQTEALWHGKFYFPLLLVLTMFFIRTKAPLAGAVTLVVVAIWMLLCCSNILAAAAPLCMISVLSTLCFRSMGVFAPCAALVVPVGMALMAHLRHWPLKFQFGRSARGLVLVSIATILGGLGVMTAQETMQPMSLYYSLGLGVLLLVIYLMVRTEMAEGRGEDTVQRLLEFCYTMGLCMALVVLWAYVESWEPGELFGAVPNLKWRNFAATILVTTLPMPFLFSVKHKFHLLSVPAMAAALALTGSRTALLFGAVMLVLCTVYLCRWGVISKRFLIALAALGLVAAVVFGPSVLSVALGNRMKGDILQHSNQSRMRFLARAVEDFLAHPLFGIGLGNTANGDIFTGVDGSMVFYHNMVAQVMGSMGIVGIVAYAVLIRDRIRLLLTERSARVDAMALMYLGMLLVSMTNPGEFCPFPNAILIAMLFAGVEQTVGDPVTSLEKLPQRRYRLGLSQH